MSSSVGAPSAQRLRAVVRAERRPDQVEVALGDIGVEVLERARRLTDALDEHQHVHRADVPRTAPASWARTSSCVEHTDDLGLGRADLRVGLDTCRATASNSARSRCWRPTISSRNSNRAVSGSADSTQLLAADGRLFHPVRHDRCDQVLLRGEVAKQRPAADAGALGDLADADVEPAFAEQRLGGVEQPPPVSLGVGS